MNAILALSTIVFPLITFPYSARILTPIGTGKVSFATSLVMYFCMFAQLGIPTYGIRTCAKARDNKEELTRCAHELLFINLIMSILSYGLLLAGIFFVPRLREEKTLIFVISITIILSAIGMEWLYKALEQYTYITLRSIIFKVIAVVAMFVFVRAKDDYIIYGGITIFAASASNILNLINVRKFISLRPVGNYNILRHLKPVMIFFAMSCATTVYTNLDMVMLGFMKTDVDTGHYTAAVKVKTVLVACITSLGEVLLPRVSYYLKNNMEEDFLRVSRKAMNFVLVASIPLMIYFILFANEAIMLLSGPAYRGAVWPMQLIMPTIVFIGVTNILGLEILVPHGRERAVLLSVSIGAAVDFVLNLVLIPGMGAAGAALATLVAEIAVFIVQMIVLRACVADVFSDVSYLKILLSAVAAVILCIWIRLIKLPSFACLAISAVLFFVTYFGVLYLTKEKLAKELADGLRGKLGKKNV